MQQSTMKWNGDIDKKERERMQKKSKESVNNEHKIDDADNISPDEKSQQYGLLHHIIYLIIYNLCTYLSTDLRDLMTNLKAQKYSYLLNDAIKIKNLPNKDKK